MSKKLIASLLAFKLILLTACNNTNHTDLSNITLRLSSPLRINEDLDAIELVVTNDVQRNSEFIELRLVNHTIHTIGYGEPFIIEFFDGGIWHVTSSLKVDYLTFVDIGFILNPGGTDYFTRYLSLRFPDGLIPGQYRLRMSISNNTDIPVRENHSHDLVAEFYIE